MNSTQISSSRLGSRFWLMILFFVAFFQTGTQAQNLSDQDSTTVVDRVVHFMESRQLFPVLAWSPETRGILGLWQQRIFTDRHERKQQLALWGIVTMNKQLEVGLEPTLRLAKDRYRLRSELSYQAWPDSYYGRESTTFEEPLSYSNERAKAELEILRQVAGPLYTGLQALAIRDRFHDSAEELGEDGLCLGMGAQILFDTRNHDLWPSRGFLVKASSEFLTYDDRTSSSRHVLNARAYHPIARAVLATQLLLSDTGGAPRFRYLSRPGEYLRALPEMKHLDRSLFVLRSEVRLMLSKRVGVVLFTGGGASAQEPWKLTRANKYTSVGMGARFALDPQEHLHVTLDLALGEEGLRSFIKLGEEF
jgi:hypothetical protein